MVRSVVVVVMALGLVACSTQPMARVVPVDMGGTTSEGPAGTFPVATALSAELATAGLDVAALPDLEDVPDKNIMVVMQAFTTSLGATCDDCHVADKTASTPNKLIAGKMWSEFVQKMKRKDGSALFCDSCHQGKLTFLDRTDDKALSGWMDANFVDGLVQKNGSAQSCTSCHGQPFDPNFLDGWAGTVATDGGIVGTSDAGTTVDAGTAPDMATTAPDMATTAPDMTTPTACVPSVNEVQVTGAGGSSDEFVELYNPCPSLSLAGYSLVYRSAAGTTDTLLVKLDGQTLAQGGYLVVGNNSYTGTAAVKYGSSLANGGGGVGLRASDGTLVDSLAWGTATNAFVQGSPAAAPSSGSSAQRSPDGSHAAADQAKDVVSRTPTPGAAN